MSQQSNPPEDKSIGLCSTEEIFAHLSGRIPALILGGMMNHGSEGHYPEFLFHGDITTCLGLIEQMKMSFTTMINQSGEMSYIEPEEDDTDESIKAD